jgi:hypothetical protein
MQGPIWGCPAWEGIVPELRRALPVLQIKVIEGVHERTGTALLLLGPRVGEWACVRCGERTADGLADEAGNDPGQDASKGIAGLLA